MAMRTTDALTHVAAVRSRGHAVVLLGGLLGLAWAAGMRGFMAQIVQEDSSVSWSGTFAYILLPATRGGKTRSAELMRGLRKRIIGGVAGA